MDRLNQAAGHICAGRAQNGFIFNQTSLILLSTVFILYSTGCHSAIKTSSNCLALNNSTKSLFVSSLFHAVISVLLFNVYCAPPGHFLFLQVSKTNSLGQASIQSSFFPAPFSTTTACQVSYLDKYCSLISSLTYFVLFFSWGNTRLCQYADVVSVFLCRCVSLCTCMGTLMVLCWWL